MHDYSDGIAIVGINPQAGALTIPSVIQHTGDTNQDGDYTHQGDRTQTGDQTIIGNLHVYGNITCTGDVVAGGISLRNHTHSGVEPGGGNTGGPQ
jgi:phage baseplate assembly protein gpV